MKKSSALKDAVHIRLPKEVVEALDVEATKLGVSRAVLARLIIVEHFRRLPQNTRR